MKGILFRDSSKSKQTKIFEVYPEQKFYKHIDPDSKPVNPVKVISDCVCNCPYITLEHHRHNQLTNTC